MRLLLLLLLATAACGSPDSAASASAEGAGALVRTRLAADEPDCRSDGGGRDSASWVLRCPGALGYALQVRGVDGRAALSVIDPDGGEHPVDAGGAVGHARESRFGDAVEWRTVGEGSRAVATALVVTHVAVRPDGPRNSAGERLDLLVVRLADEVCVTDRIPAATEARAEARRLAETAATRPCRAAG